MSSSLKRNQQGSAATHKADDEDNPQLMISVQWWEPNLADVSRCHWIWRARAIPSRNRQAATCHADVNFP